MLQKKENMTASSDYIQLTKDYSAPNYAPLDVVITKGEGCWVWDVEGNKYLDFLSAYSAVNFGHCNERIRKVAEDQLKKLTLTSRSFYTDELALLTKEISDFLGYEMSLFMNSGAEAVETAIKTARRWGYTTKKIEENKAEIIVFDKNFHGRTTTIISFSDSVEGRRAFGPYTEGFVMCKYGDIESVKKAVNKNTVAILVEPIQGEGGINIPPAGFLKSLKSLCEAEKLLFIADEIQTGLCRTGRVLCCDHDNVKPDLVVLGKSLGGGIIPISVVLGNKDTLSLLLPGSHGSTFGGNPFACRIAREVISIIKEDKPEVHVTKVGERLKSFLSGLNSPYIKEIRGRGLLIGIEFKPEAGKAKKFCLDLLDKNLLTKDTREQTLRLAPPLIIDDSALDWGMERIKSILV